MSHHMITTMGDSYVSSMGVPGPTVAACRSGIEIFITLLLTCNSKYYLSSENTFEQWALTKYVSFRRGVPVLCLKVMAAATPSWRRMASDVRLFRLTFDDASIMLLQYVEELWKKKQSDVLRFLQRVRCWEYRQLPSITRLNQPSRPDKARRMGYKAKQGYVVYRVRVRRGGRKKPVSKVRPLHLAAEPSGNVHGSTLRP